MSVARPAADLVNAMTVDVEDYFQVHAFADRVDLRDWPSFQCRVERNIDAILAMLDEAGRLATFFTLGWIAERYPQLLRRIAAQGHELASHGMAHIRADRQTPAQFRADVRRSRAVIEDVSATAVAGYRAASFSIGRDNLWALDVLGEEGYAYSSSIYPIRHDHYGMAESPRFAHRPRGAGGILEVPVSTISVRGLNLPCGGGGYFRLLPYQISRWQIRRVNRVDGQPSVFYFHPWEIDPGQPRQAGLSMRTRVRHYTNLGAMAGRLRCLLSDFPWDRMDRIFLRRAEQER
jgi:polysaccharide deacetylase family protein (PEP-CTERM system associated)